MRQVRCTLPPGGALTVQAGSFSRTIGPDDVVDLDQVLVAAVPKSKDGPARPAVTLEDVLGHHVAEAFEPVQTSAQAAKSSKAAAAAQE